MTDELRAWMDAEAKAIFAAETDEDDGSPIPPHVKVSRPNRPWPGYCQSCYAALNPPDATSCRACGADDIDD